MAMRPAGGCGTRSANSAFDAFPAEHWPKLRSINPLERFNREIGRRSDVVGIFPDDASLIRLVSMLAIEANDEWLVGRSYSARSRWRLSGTTEPRRISHELQSSYTTSHR
jgi:putative transposase